MVIGICIQYILYLEEDEPGPETGDLALRIARLLLHLLQLHTKQSLKRQSSKNKPCLNKLKACQGNDIINIVVVQPYV